MSQQIYIIIFDIFRFYNNKMRLRSNGQQRIQQYPASGIQSIRISMRENSNTDVSIPGYVETHFPIIRNNISTNQSQNINRKLNRTQNYEINSSQPYQKQANKSIMYPQASNLIQQSSNNLYNCRLYTQQNQQSTYPTLIKQLNKAQQQVEKYKQYISTLQQKQIESTQKINTLNSIMHSFYTKGAPLQSQLQKQIFDGSYPTLIQQADATRKQLANKKQELQRLKYEKNRNDFELKQIRSRVNWYYNRIGDLERDLKFTYQKIDGNRIQDPRINLIVQQNNQLKYKIQQIQQQHQQMVQQNKKLNQLISQKTTPQSYLPQLIRKKQPQFTLIFQPQLSLNIQTPYHTEFQPPPKIQPLIQRNQSQAKIIPDFNNYQIVNQFSNLHKTQKQLQVYYLEKKLNRLRQQNFNLQNEHSTQANRYKKQTVPQISILDEKQRNPFELSCSTNNKTDDKQQSFAELVQIRVQNLKKQTQKMIKKRI